MSTHPPIELPDPRPTVAEVDGLTRLKGYTCTKCGYPLAVAGPWCPVCQSELEARDYGPQGRVWSSTVFRVPLSERRPPWVLVWVDLIDGPRILALVQGGTERLPIGTLVELVGTSEYGDPLVGLDEDAPEGAVR